MKCSIEVESLDMDLVAPLFSRAPAVVRKKRKWRRLWRFDCLYSIVTVKVTVLLLDPTVGDPLKSTVYVPGVDPLNTS